ncbi:MAG: D-alanyl-D-alanine carboxypeptidase/D-alanyl-D-alanine-endopeptidase [Bacteroidota bacterium]
MITKFLSLLLFLLQSMFAYSQSQSKLHTEIEKLKADVDLQHAVWSICVMPVKKDTILTEYQSNISLIPASTLKIVTTGAALSMLGSDFRFETKIEYDGTLDTVTGILKGNVYIVGGGDPTLESQCFKDPKDSLTTTDKWAIILKSKGIKSIEGAIIGDASIFDDNIIPPQWIWADIGNYFGAGACGLSYHDNKYTLLLKSGVNGSNTVITKTIPEIKGLQVVNTVTAGGDDDNAYIYGAPYSYYRKIQGTIPANKTDYEVNGSMPDPALFCAQALEKSLMAVGIRSTLPPTTIRILNETYKAADNTKYTLFTNLSPPLSEIVYWTNLKSNNLFAEHLLKYISYKKNGLGKENDGTEIITEFWKNKGADVSGFFMNDGCGLSRSNVITTKTEAQILRLMSEDKTFDTFLNSLPVAGKSGSLVDLCTGTCAQNNLCAKSGYIIRARGYAGYVKNKKGEMLCFSLMANNYECTAAEMKKKLEKLLIAIAEME